MNKKISVLATSVLSAFNLFLAQPASATVVTDYVYLQEAPQSFTVPEGITELLIEARGADGAGATPNPIVCGGSGALVTSIVTVSPGAQLVLYVGKQGYPGFGNSSGSTGGWGYGYGGWSDGYSNGGGGGGTAVLLLGSPLVVAGGGGGAARTTGGGGGNAGNSDGSGASGSGPNGGGGGSVGNAGSGGATGKAKSWANGGHGGSTTKDTGVGGGGGGGYGGGAPGQPGSGGGGGGSMAVGTQNTFSTATYGSACISGSGNDNSQRYGSNGYIKISLVTTAPDSPTIDTATALSPTSASISFTAPANDGGATIETYTATATSTTGSATQQVLQAESGVITFMGLTSSTAYTFTVTASNSVGTSLASAASISITTPASDEELAAQAAEAAAQRKAAARAASEAAAAQREAEKKSARSEISNKIKSSEKVTIEIFQQAQIAGITEENIEAIQVEIATLPEESRADITQVLKVARKYEVVGIIASERITTIYSNSLIEIGLIPSENKHKAAITAAIKALPQSERSSYAAIKEALDVEMAEIQARKDRLTAVLTLIASRNS